MSFNDARCPKCNRKIGWTGSVENCPPCPQCEYQIPLEELKAAEDEMRAFERLLLEKKGKKTFE
jgi:hypothetical protein